jgi:hypothetical protein
MRMSRQAAVAPLRLSQEQLEQIMRTAGPIPQDLRSNYLLRIADLLRDRDFGDGDVYRAAAMAAKQVLWSIPKAG